MTADITKRVDSLHAGVLELISNHVALLVDLDSGLVKTQALCVGHATQS